MKKQLAHELIDFIHEGSSPYHVVQNTVSILEKNNFRQLSLGDDWILDAGEKYFVSKNNSALFAWVQGKESVHKQGFRIIAAHTDSPSFKIKPQAEILSAGCLKLNTEVYGGPILYTWFDRPLSMAGRVFVRGSDVLHPKELLVRFDRPILVIPHLAIHLNRSVNDGNPLSKQKDMLPILTSQINDQLTSENYLLNLLADELKVNASDILDFDLSLFEFTKGCLCGLNEEFISSRSLDDQAMVHAGLKAILQAQASDATLLLALFDNEEVGSGTKQGAGSPVLQSILRRIVMNYPTASEESYFRALHHTFVISADMAHALHPNYVEKYDLTNHPIINKGPVIKINSNQKYITDAQSSAVFKVLCEKANVPYQYFVNHSDALGGSTLGNVLLAQMDVKGVDVGNPMWAMHSARETSGVNDHYDMIEVFKQFFK